MIRLLQTKTTKHHEWTVLLRSHNFQDPKIIAPARKKPEYSSSSLEYMLLKQSYQQMEFNQNRNTPIMKSYLDYLEVQGVIYDFTRSNYSFVQMMAIFNTLLVTNYLYCTYCSKHLQPLQISLDHYIPQYDGGKDEVGNFKVSCYQCNNIKAAINPYNDIKYFNYFLEYVKTNRPKNRESFLKFLLEEKRIQVSEYGLLVEKLNLSINKRIYLLYSMSKEKIEFNALNAFNLKQISKTRLSYMDQIYLKEIEKTYYQDEITDKAVENN